MVAGLVGRKADAFAALLDGTGKAGATDPALAHLAQITQRLSAVPQPSPAFKAALRQQLVHTATASATAAHAAGGALHVPQPRVSPGHGAGGAGGAAGSGASGTSSAIMGLGKSAPIWIKIFSGIAAATVAGTGVGVGAHRALPGDPFYGIKKQVEAVQLDLASGTRDKAKVRLGFAHARINELKQLIKQDHVTPTSQLSAATEGHIRGLLQAWAEDAGVATTSLIQEIRALGSSAATAQLSAQLRQLLSSFTLDQFGQLGGLLASVPTGPLQSLTVSALGYLQRVDGVLGGNPATLIQQLPIPLTAIPDLQNVIPQLNLPVGTAGTLPSLGSVLSGGKGGITIPNPLPSGIASAAAKLPKPLASLHIPTAIPSIGVPKTSNGNTSPSTPSLGGILPKDNGLTGVISNVGGALTGGSGSTGSGNTGGVGGAVTGVTGSLGGAVSSVGGAVSSAGAGPVGGAVSSVGGVVSNVGGAASNVSGAVSSVGATVGNTASGATSGASGAVGSTIGTVTGGLSSSSGPSLPLPTALPTLPPLPKLPGLGG